MHTAIQDPDAVKDWLWDWSRRLTDGEKIATHELIAPGATITHDSSTDTSVTAFIGPCTAQGHTDVTCRVTTTAGRVFDWTLRLYLMEE